MLKKKTLHKTSRAQLNETIFSAQKNVNKLSNASSKITPNATVQVDMKFHKLASNIFQVLHSKDGKRVDSNIWSFPNYEAAYEFVDTLMLLGVDEKNIIYPASFLLYGKENQQLQSEDEFSDELDILEDEIGEDGEIDLYGEDEIEYPDEEFEEQDLTSIDQESEEEFESLENLESEESTEEESPELEQGLEVQELENEVEGNVDSQSTVELEELENEVESNLEEEEDAELEELENQSTDVTEDEDGELEQLLKKLEQEYSS